MGLYTKIIDRQKLFEAWKKVKSNHPAPGSDHVTVEEFENREREEIANLSIELKEKRYVCKPVKTVTIQKDEKEREVSLYSVRDKIVQTSIAVELTRLFDARLSKNAFAYRKDKSALNAIGIIEDELKSARYRYFCKLDIHKFFDCIPLDTLRAKLRNLIQENDVLDLIFLQLCAPSFGANGELTKKKIGIYQGNAFSPILSNLYLSELDRAMDRFMVFYGRYSDDCILLANEKNDLERAKAEIEKTLHALGLKFNSDKTRTGEISEGFSYLGYLFDDKGKQIPVKAKQKLNDSLEDVWLDSKNQSILEKLEKCSRILNGWEQYYRGEDKIHNIYEFTTLMYMLRNKPERKALFEKRREFFNHFKEIAVYLLEIWKENRQYHLQILEYEQYFGLGDGKEFMENSVLYHEILEIYSRLLQNAEEETWGELLQAYMDLEKYDIAEKIQDKLKERKQEGGFVHFQSESATEEEPEDSEANLEILEDMFVGREDYYVRETFSDTQKRQTDYIPEPLTKEVLSLHLKGRETIGTYIMRNNNTVKYLVFDIDISKKMLSTKNYNLQEGLKSALKQAKTMQDMLKNMGLHGYIEFSGFRGYHLWIFFREWLPIRYVNVLAEIILSRSVESKGEITVEAFPNKFKKNLGSAGQRLKIPYGIHLLSGKRSHFLDSFGNPLLDLVGFSNSAARYSLEQIRRVIGANISEVSRTDKSNGESLIEVDFEKLGNPAASLAVTIQGCNLCKYLINKAANTGYLTHMERQSILYVFGHLGEDGKEFVHKVMEFTLNYQYHVTQRFIDKIPEKPISCIKLREQYKQITAEYGCNCTFKRTRNCYPSPVMHAIKNNNDDCRDITIPTGRKITEARVEKVYDEINIHVKVQELAAKLMELKKQSRNLSKSVRKVESELCSVYDSANTDAIEVDLGVLIRRKCGNGYEWVIEI